MANKINCFVALTPENYEDFNRAIVVAGHLLEDAIKDELIENPLVDISSEPNGIEVKMKCLVPYVKEETTE